MGDEYDDQSSAYDEGESPGDGNYDNGTLNSDEQTDLPEQTVTASRDPTLNEQGQAAVSRVLSDATGASGSDYLDRMQQVANAKRDALLEARKQLLARKHSDASSWLSFAAGLGSPTHSGSFFESLGNANRDLLPQLQEREQWKDAQQNALMQNRQQIAGMGGESGDAFDPEVAKQQLALQQIRLRNLGNVAGRYTTAAMRQPSTGTPPELVRLQQYAATLQPGDPNLGPVNARIKLLSTPKADPNATYNLTDVDKKALAAVANYQQPLASVLGRAGTNEKRQAMSAYLADTYPSYSPTGITDIQQLEKDYNSNSVGKPGGQIVASNTLVNHLDTLRELAAQLNNGKLKGANAVKNWLGMQTGDPSLTNITGALQIVGPELAKAVSGNATSAEERTQLAAIASGSASPDQLVGLLGNDSKMASAIAGVLPKLLAGKVTALGQGYYAGIPQEALGRYSGNIEKKLSAGTLKMMRDQGLTEWDDGRPIDFSKLAKSDKAAASAPKTVVRTGTEKGTNRKIVQYSDGTTGYAQP